MTGPGRRRWCRAAAVLAAAAALAACSAEGSAADGDHDHGDGPVPAAGPAAPARHTGPQGGVAQFVVECAHSHSAPDDPIVHPGKPGYAHLHDFFGNTSTDAGSTLASLLEADTSCARGADTAAYWAPALLDGADPVTPTTSFAYYRPAPGVDPARVRAFPPGLMVIAGDQTATEPQPTDLVGWTCGSSPRNHAAPPDCPRTSPLRAVITFPDCWDGQRTDSDDHASHMANSSEGECPSSHPVHVPQLTFAIDYPVWGVDHDLSLASGSVHSLHADFVNAWDQADLEGRVRDCLWRDVVCGVVSNRGHNPLFSG